MSFFAVLKTASWGLRVRCHFEAFFIRGVCGLEQNNYQNLLLTGSEKGRDFVQSDCLNNRAAEIGSALVGDFCPGVCAWSVSRLMRRKSTFSVSEKDAISALYLLGIHSRQTGCGCQRLKLLCANGQTQQIGVLLCGLHFC